MKKIINFISIVSVAMISACSDNATGCNCPNNQNTEPEYPLEGKSFVGQWHISTQSDKCIELYEMYNYNFNKNNNPECPWGGCEEGSCPSEYSVQCVRKIRRDTEENRYEYITQFRVKNVADCDVHGGLDDGEVHGETPDINY